MLQQIRAHNPSRVQQSFRLALHHSSDCTADPLLERFLVEHAVFVEEAVVAALY